MGIYWVQIDMKKLPLLVMKKILAIIAAVVGAYVFNDVAGPARRSGLMAAASVQIKSSYKTRLSFGVSGSFTQFMIDRDKLVTEEPGDNTVINYTTNQLIPDLSAGIHWFSHNYHIGISALNLLETKSDLYDIMTPVTNTIDRTLYLNGSYRFGSDENSKISFEPAAILRFMTQAPLQFDLSGRIFYKQQFYLGASYRFKDALAILIGYDGFVIGFGYAYDLGLSNLNGFHSGSHEVVLTFKTKRNKSTQKNNYSNRIYDCPSFN